MVIKKNFFKELKTADELMNEIYGQLRNEVVQSKVRPDYKNVLAIVHPVMMESLKEIFCDYNDYSNTSNLNPILYVGNYKIEFVRSLDIGEYDFAFGFYRIKF